MRLLPLALLVGLALPLPTAAAHAVPADLLIEPFVSPLPFANETAAVANVTFQWRCAGFSNDESTSSAQRVVLHVERVPEWVDLRVEPTIVELPACVGVGETRIATLSARVREGGLPALSGTVGLRAEWTTPEFTTNVTAESGVAGRYVSSYVVNASQRAKTERPQVAVSFPVDIENLGNGNTRFVFEIVEKTEDLLVLVPLPVTLQPAGGQSKASIPVTVQTPYHNGRLAQTDTFTLRVQPHAALDPRLRGEPTELTFTVETKGWYVPLPAPLAVLSLAGVGLLLGRRT